MNPIVVRFNDVVNEVADGNGSAFAKMIGFKQTTIHNYIKGRIPNAAVMAAMREHLGVDLNWLVTGDGTMFGVDPPPQPDPHADLPPIDEFWLVAALAVIELRENEAGKRLPPHKKGKLICMAYQRLHEVWIDDERERAAAAEEHIAPLLDLLLGD